MLKITYIRHDCFLLETGQLSAVFDYYNFDSAAEEELPYFLQRIPKEKPLYVIVSHHHKDHFTPRIFGWSRKFANIHYIISNDTHRIAKHYFTADSRYSGPLRTAPESVTVLKPGEEYSDNLLTVRAFSSTDIGNSYALHTAERTVFHAGDLNAWIWRDESTDEEVAEAMQGFEKVLADLSAYTDRFDIAMFPVDARIGTGFFTGAATFVRKFTIGIFIPMHFCLGENEAQQEQFRGAAADFSLYANQERGAYAALTKRGDAIAIPDSDKH